LLNCVKLAVRGEELPLAVVIKQQLADREMFL
jgi:hypothetical protein